MSGRSIGSEGMYTFIMNSGVRGMLELSATSGYGDILLGVGILATFLLEYMFLWIMARVLPFGGLIVINCGFLCRFMSFV